MTFTQLTRTLAENHNISHTLAKALAKDLFATLTDSLARGEHLRIAGFGTFSLTHVNERSLTQAMGGGVLPAHNRVKFKSAAALKEAVN